MIKKILLALFILTTALIHSQEWNQNKEQTKVTFKIKNFGVYVDGDFSDVEIKTNFDSTNVSESYINATIQVKSIDTGIKGRDKHILEEDYFDEPNHKMIQLKSQKIKKNSDNTHTLFAELTIKGITKKIEIPLDISENNNQVLIKSNFTINRRDFKIGGGSLIMSKKVKVQVEFMGTR